MKLFAKGKGGPGASAEAAPPTFRPIDRMGLLSVLDQVVNAGQSGLLELQEPRGAWSYAFQGGALTHASGGRVRGARQAFDLLWEFQQGEYRYTPGTGHGLGGNLYIDKSRLLDLLRRSQAAIQGPASPYIAPDQQRPIAPAAGYPAPPGGVPGWGPPPQRPPAAPAAAWPPAYPQPGPLPAGYPAGPAVGPQAPVGYPQPFPAQAYPQPGGQPVPQQPFAAQPPAPPIAPVPPAPSGPVPAGQNPGVPFPGVYPGGPAPQAAPPPPAVPRPATPPSFSVPPMPIPKKQPVYQPPAPAPAPAAPAPAAAASEPASAPPVDDLRALRASLVAQAPAPTPPATNWKVRTAEGAVAPPPVKSAAGASKKGDKKPSRLRAAIDLQLIKFLLWACERRYSPDDHWTLKDAFEVSTMELRDQFVGAFSQSFKSTPKATLADDDADQLSAGRSMRGRAKPRKR
ncbi:MAG TPA: DUF4388 domain-containing protein [Candidatus Limnocylindrales bacterium]|nr:DUF4388 domain-containing protein [Candidatus Limnocylindrales bacterium]